MDVLGFFEWHISVCRYGLEAKPADALGFGSAGKLLGLKVGVLWGTHTNSLSPAEFRGSSCNPRTSGPGNFVGGKIPNDGGVVGDRHHVDAK